LYKKAISSALFAPSLLFLAGAASFGQNPAAPNHLKSTVHPAALRSANPATLAGAGPSYGVFKCQVGLVPQVCYDPYQVRKAYQLDGLITSGLTGKGKTIVIVDAFQAPNIANQLNFFDSFYGLPGLNGLGNPNNDPSLGTFKQVAPNGLTTFVPGDPVMTGWAEEISLDVLWAHAIAPGANITLVLAKSNNDADILSAEKYAIDNNLGDIISQSFGENESCVSASDLQTYNQLFAEATQKGITLFASSADDGAAQQTCDGFSWVRAVSSPASSPLVTAVGGTELHAANYCLTALKCNPTANPAAGTYQGEIAWNEFNPSISTGGGFSVLYNEPSYQQGTIPGGKQRAVPDVAYNGAVFHGVLTYLDIPGVDAGFYLFGGTSAGSPQWAAILAIADQKAGRNLGFINKALYKIGQAQQHYSASLNDVTSGNNSVVEQDAKGNNVVIQGFSSGTGWNPTTGLGSPIASELVDYLNQFVSPGDGTSAIAESQPHGNGNPNKPGKVQSH
jgi:subtilase family serine protease